jgi:hypothetical protein
MRFHSNKSLEEVLYVLKDKIPIVPTHEPIQVVLNKSTVKKKGKCEKQSSTNVNFTNKRRGRLLSRKLRNQQRGNDKLNPVIEVDDHFAKDDIDIFIAQENVDDQFLGNNINTDAIQFNLISNFPPFLKNQDGFSGIQHDMKQITGLTKLPSAKQAQPLPTLEPVHCENRLDWVEIYYQDIPYIQAQLNQMVAQNSLLERENDELKAYVQWNAHRENKRIKRVGNVIIKNSKKFNTIINSDLSDASLSNL